MNRHIIPMAAAAFWIMAFPGLAGHGLGQEQTLPKPAAVDVQSHLGVGQIRMDGHIGRRMSDCMENLITAWDQNRIIDPFRYKTDTRDDQWRGDYWGKWFTALAWGYAHQPTLGHRQWLDRAVYDLMATQGPDGYIGTFEGDMRLIGAYDVWSRQCTILGLTAYYDLTSDPSALEAACRSLDCLIDELQQRNLRLADLSWPRFMGLAPSVTVESGALLYQRTGRQKYLDFAKQIVAQWHEPGKLAPNGLRLIEDALAGKPATEIGYPKAYEQMYCFIGICEMYRATGQRKYLDAAAALAKNIREEELFITGTGSEGENWFKGRTQQTRIVFNPGETCVTTHWMYLCWQLLRLTGDPVYADDLETSLYNALLGALLPDGRWFGYYDGLLGERVPSWVAQADIGLSCCIVSGCRGLMLTPFWAVMQTAEGPAVNLYFPGQAETRTASGGKVLLEMATDYPREGTARITVKPDQPETFTVALRIPAWSRQTSLKINGDTHPVQPGTYAKINRPWRSGDQIELTLDLQTRVVEAPDGKGQIALQRGPVVLALDDRFVPTQPDTEIELDRNAAALAELKPNPQAAQQAGTWMAFEVPFLVNGAPKMLTLCDYSSAGNRWNKTNRFRTWLPQPLELSAAYETGDAWHSAIRVVAPDLQAERGVRLDDLALAGKGATVTADSEYDKEPACTGEAIDGIIAGPWDFSNRWVSTLDTPHPHWIEVKLPQPARIGTIVIRFADPAGYPTSFQGVIRVDGRDQTVFDVDDCLNRNPRYYRADIDPVTTDTFRLIIRASANPAYANACQISEIELYPPAPPDPQPARTPGGCAILADRILFLGNSITFHPPAPQVYWDGNWGMAAGSEEKDYVHLLTNSFAALTGKQPQISVNNIADFERNFESYDIESGLKEQLAFRPDIAVIAIGENVPPLNTEALQAGFRKSFLHLLHAVKNSGRPVIYVRSCFWPEEIRDNIMRQCCAEIGGLYVYIGQLGRDESMMARSERSYQHDGVAAHPGDKGMQAIADLLFKAMTAQP